MATRPLIATPDGTVIAGNMRLRAVQQLGWKGVPTVFAEMDEVLAKERALRDNGSWGESSTTARSLGRRTNGSAREQRARGCAILLISSELDEIVRSPIASR